MLGQHTPPGPELQLCTLLLAVELLRDVPLLNVLLLPGDAHETPILGVWYDHHWHSLFREVEEALSQARLAQEKVENCGKPTENSTGNRLMLIFLFCLIVLLALAFSTKVLQATLS